MRIVQLSDIHLSKTNLTDFKNYYRKALIEDLLEFHQKKAIDVILITGDLVDQGGSSLGKNPYKIFEEEFMKPLMSALALKAYQILMIPGNHDIDRDGIEEENEFYLIGKLDKEMANTMLNKTKAKFTKENKRIKKFKTFEKAFHLGSPSYSYSNNESMAIIESKGHKFGIALINDSWRCSKELKSDNHFIGANQLFNAKEYFGHEKTHFNIAVFHHPIDVFNTNEREVIENILKSTNFEMAVFGHKHNYKFEHILSPNGGYLTLQGRTAFSRTEEKESRYQSGYSLVDINLEEKTYTLYARKFIFEGFHFDLDVDSVRGGTISGPILQKQNYVALAASENNEDKELPDSYTAEVNRIVTLLVGKSLYEDPYIFVRELIQNAVDACNREKSKNTHKLPLIKFRINSKEQYIEVEDEGDGMTKAVVKHHFAVIGQSISHEFNDSNGKFNLISQFGIGFISTFIVAQKVVVTTRHEDDQQISFQINNVFKGFSYKETVPEQQQVETGTKVRVYFKKGYDPVAAFAQVRRYCRHVENLKVYFDEQEMQLAEDWNVNQAKSVQIIPTDKYELRIGISAQTRQLIASNSGFMINEMPMQLIPYKFPYYIGGEVNFKPRAIDFDMSRSNIIESEKSQVFRKELSAYFRKMVREALDSEEKPIAQLAINSIHYYLTFFDQIEPNMQRDYIDFYSKKELLELCAKYTKVRYQNIELPIARAIEILQKNGIKTIYVSPTISNNEPETLAIHYLEDNGNLVLRQRNYNVHFRDGGNLVSFITVVQLIASENGMKVTDTSTSYQNIIESMKLDKTTFPAKLIEQVSTLEVRYGISVEIAPFRASKPSVKLINQSYINANYPAFVHLVAEIDKIETKDLSIYISGLLGLRLNF